MLGKGESVITISEHKHSDDLLLIPPQLLKAEKDTSLKYTNSARESCCIGGQWKSNLVILTRDDRIG